MVYALDQSALGTVPLKTPTAGDLQWNVLIAATLAISAFVMVDSGSSDGESGIPLMGVVLILVDVVMIVSSHSRTY